MVIAALIIIGGLQRIAAVAERVVPLMAVLYIIGALIVFLTNITRVEAMFTSIFKFAFGIKAVGGAAGRHRVLKRLQHRAASAAFFK